MSTALKAQIMGYVEAELFDFNMLHALEKIETTFNTKIAQKPVEWREPFRPWRVPRPAWGYLTFLGNP